MIKFKEILKEYYDVEIGIQKGIYKPEDVKFNDFLNSFDVSFEPENSSFEKYKECYNIAMKIFTSLPDPIPIYRAIVLRKGATEIDKEKPGISWTYDLKTAYQWFNLCKDDVDESNENYAFYILSAKVNKRHVNWPLTFKRFFCWTWKDRTQYHHFDENEIKLKYDTINCLLNFKAIEIDMDAYNFRHEVHL